MSMPCNWVSHTVLSPVPGERSSRLGSRPWSTRHTTLSDRNGDTTLRHTSCHIFSKEKTGRHPHAHPPHTTHDAWHLENMPVFAHVIVLPSTSVKGRIGDANKPKAEISTGFLDMNDYYYSLLRITSDKDVDDAFWIDVDVRGLINTEDKEHGSSIPANVFKGTVDRVHVPTSRYENPTEAGWTIRFVCDAVPSFWCAVDLAVEMVVSLIAGSTLYASIQFGQNTEAFLHQYTRRSTSVCHIRSLQVLCV